MAFPLDGALSASWPTRIDPHGEHDFGSFTLAGRKFFWNIRLLEREYRIGSEYPANPTKKRHASLTIMRERVLIALPVSAR
jgi:hypothetical protein